LQVNLPSELALRGRYLRAFGELEEAEKVLSASLVLDKDYLPAILELTDLYRKNNRQFQKYVLDNQPVQYYC
jgi:hypothetical protein